MYSTSSPKPSEAKARIEWLIGEVAKRHKVLISPDDPIFMTVTLNELLLADTLGQLQTAVIASQDHIAAGTAQAHAAQLATSKRLGEQLVTAAAEHIASEVRTAAGEAVDAMRAAVTAELRAGRQASADMRQMRASVWWATALAFAAVAIAGTLAAVSPLLDSRYSGAANCRPAVTRQTANNR